MLLSLRRNCDISAVLALRFEDRPVNKGHGESHDCNMRIAATPGYNGLLLKHILMTGAIFLSNSSMCSNISRLKRNIL